MSFCLVAKTWKAQNQGTLDGDDKTEDDRTDDSLWDGSLAHQVKSSCRANFTTQVSYQ